MAAQPVVQSPCVLLKTLHIRDYALIEELDVEFSEGLNIITGETGAGKSILLGALQLLMGSRASTEVVRTGRTKAIVEGIFDPRGDASVDLILDRAGVESQEVLIVRREVTSSYSRAFVNDTPVNLGVLRDLADCLVDLHGQHQHQSLLREETHCRFVDEIGGYADLLQSCNSAFDDAVLVDREIADLQKRKARLDERRELSQFQLAEIETVAPTEGEDDALQKELDILDNAESIRKAADGVFEVLYDSEGAVVDILDSQLKELDGVVRHDERLQSFIDEIRSAIIVLQEVASELNSYSGDIDFDPERIAFVRDRLADYDRLHRKYGTTAAEILKYAAQLREELQTVESFDERLATLHDERQNTLDRLGNVSRELSKERQHVASTIEVDVVGLLQHLNIKEAQFEIRFSYDVSESGKVVVDSGDRVAVSRDGFDVVRFFISTNPGESPKPLAEVASGGEISRVMLVLKSILARSGGIPLMVFDEIDVGISGRVAQQVGRKLRELASNHQVISITHLPQIAAMADRHFVVEKKVESGRTRSAVRMLEESERAPTIALLISGSEVTETAIASARELLNSV